MHSDALAQPESVIAADALTLWSDTEASPVVRDLSHWVGEGRWADQEKWRRIGQEHFGMYEKLCSMANMPRPIKNMLEWGPGGGANAIAFTNEVQTFWGADISAGNLEECMNQLQVSGFNRFRPILVDVSKPEAVLKSLTEQIDFFLCTAVSQHFPSKEYGTRVTQIAYRALADNGIALIQNRYDDGTPAVKSKNRDYFNNVVTFTSYSIEEYWEIARRVGFTPLSVLLQPLSNYAYYLLHKTPKNLNNPNLPAAVS
ncbi:MAG: class I SAM-dependent methyltransferase [Pseudomonadota bacterium]